MIGVGAIVLAHKQDNKRRTAIIIAAIAIAHGDEKAIQACLRRNRTTTSMRAIS